MDKNSTKPYSLILFGLIYMMLTVTVWAQCPDEGCPPGLQCEEGNCVVNLEIDSDRDGVPDAIDNCPDFSNPAQQDGDGDGRGNACDETCFAVEEPCKGNTGWLVQGSTGRGVNGDLEIISAPETMVIFETVGDERTVRHTTISDGDGFYRMYNLLPGEYNIFIGLPSFDGPPSYNGPFSYHSILLSPDNRDSFVGLVFDPKGSLFGRVQLEGKRLGEHGGVIVSIVVNGEEMETTTTDDGSFTLEGISATTLLNEPTIENDYDGSPPARMLRFSRIGYLEVTLPVVVSPFSIERVREVTDDSVEREVISLKRAPWAEDNENHSIEVGDEVQLTDYSLQNLEDETMYLESLQEKNGAVLIFTSNACGFNPEEVDTYRRIEYECRKNGFDFLLINSNHGMRSEGESIRDMQRIAKRHRIKYPYVFDEGAELARHMGATHVTQTYLINQDDILAFKATVGSESKENVDYLMDALKEIGGGNTDYIFEEKPEGCSISISSKK